MRECASSQVSDQDELILMWRNTGVINVDYRNVRSHRAQTRGVGTRATLALIGAIALASTTTMIGLSTPLGTHGDRSASITHDTATPRELDLNELRDRRSDAWTDNTSRGPAPRSAHTEELHARTYVAPVPLEHISTTWKEHITGSTHRGLDIVVAHGTPIHAVTSGIVVQVGQRYRGFGRTVIIDHGDGYMSLYAHTSRTSARLGEHVLAGDVIAFVGATGNATGAHLHLGVARTRSLNEVLSTWIDPVAWLATHGIFVDQSAQ